MVQTARNPRPQEGATRGRLLAAAGRLFATHGYDATSVRMIAEAAGVTDPALYYYFPTKKDLHHALLVPPDLDGLTPPGQPLEAAIESFIAYFLRCARSSDLGRMTLRDPMNGDPAALAFRTQTFDAFSAFVSPFFACRYGADAETVEAAVTQMLVGTFWDSLLTCGAQFEEVVSQPAYAERLRRLLRVSLPDPRQSGHT